MKNQPLVSVLMTAYNREKYISEAIESVLSSTYENFELIIVDDGSNDNTVSIAKAFEDQDDRVKLYLNEQNLGDYPNRNQAASYAKGKYLKYVDADDYIYPTGLEILINMMEQFPNAGYGLCSLTQNINRPFPFSLSPKTAYEYHYFGTGLFHKAPLSSIIRRDVFEKVGGFDKARMVSDFEMWHRLSCKFEVVLMPLGIVWYRIHEEQEMSDYYKFKSAYESIEDRYLKSDLNPLEIDQIKNLTKKKSIEKWKALVKNILVFRFKASFYKLKSIVKI